MQVYVIIVMHIYLLKEQKLPLEKEQMVQYFEILKKQFLKNCASFIKCISKMNNAKVYNVEDLDVNCDVNV